MSAKRFIFAEAALADELGLPQKNLRAVRTGELTRGEHWQHVANEVRYSEDGRARLFGALNLAPPAGYLAPKNPAEPPPAGSNGTGPAAAAAAAAPPRHGDVRELVCIRLFPLNKRILAAKLGGLEVRVRVADNRNITLGMALRCRLIGGDLWELARPLPRWRGKW